MKSCLSIKEPKIGPARGQRRPIRILRWRPLGALSGGIRRVAKLAFGVAWLVVGCGGERIVGGGVSDGGTVAVSDAGAPEDAGVVLGDGGGASDGGIPDAGGGDAGTVCRPDLDGVIRATEVPFVLGATASYVTNQDGTVAEGITTTGRDGGAGRVVWDFAAAHNQDHRVLDEVIAPAGKWWAAAYPSATFAALLDRATGLLGVYASTPAALTLLGTVSTEANRTNVRLDPAVDVLRFPLELGKTWQVSSTGTGFVNFTPLSTSNTYRFLVDGRGDVWTPAARFPSLRLRMDLEQTIPLTLFRRTVRAFVFLSECWGTVARVTGVDNDMSTELTRASEWRRLAP